MIKRNFKTIISLLSLHLLIGCATVRPLSTSSGRPEVTINNTTKKEVLDNLTNSMIIKGFQIKNISDYNAIFSKKTNSFATGIIYGTDYDRTVESRHTYTILENNPNVRVIATVEIVSNPGSAFEKATDVMTIQDNQSVVNDIEVALKRVQENLNNIKISIEEKNK